MAEPAPESRHEDAHRHGPPHLGSLEEEADKLVQAAASWWQERQQTSRGSAAAEGSGTGSEHTGESERGGERSGERACTGCPWCRARSAMGPIGSDTIDSLADLLDAAASSLRSFAAHRRADREEGEPAGADPRPGSWTAHDADDYDVEAAQRDWRATGGRPGPPGRE